MMSLIDQLNSATAKELAGYQPMADHLDRSVLELLDTLDELADALREDRSDRAESAIQISCLVSMIRVKLGFPATIHATPMSNRESAA